MKYFQKGLISSGYRYHTSRGKRPVLDCTGFMPNLNLKPIYEVNSKMENLQKGDPGLKTIKVDWEAPASENSIKAVLKEINYPAAD